VQYFLQSIIEIIIIMSMIIKDNLQQMTITQIDILIYSDKVLLTYRVIINLF